MAAENIHCDCCGENELLASTVREREKEIDSDVLNLNLDSERTLSLSVVSQRV